MTGMPITLCRECDNYVWDTEYESDIEMCKECETVWVEGREND